MGWVYRGSPPSLNPVSEERVAWGDECLGYFGTLLFPSQIAPGLYVGAGDCVKISLDDKAQIPRILYLKRQWLTEIGRTTPNS